MFFISAISYIFILIVIIAMVAYQTIVQSTKGTFDEEGNQLVPPTMTDKITGYVYTGTYACVVIIFGQMYKKLAFIQTLRENHRY